MLKSLSKVIIVITMLIAFVGQAFAYSMMSCSHSGSDNGGFDNSSVANGGHAGMVHVEMNHANMSHAQHAQHAQHANMSHDQHANMAHADTMTSKIASTPDNQQTMASSQHNDCCDADCSTSVCASFSVLSSHVLLATDYSEHHAISSLIFSVQSSFVTSLYRPPIIA
ncbi:hypothetical protein [Thalassotalea sp. PLHSN55]|uniref:hypothetical protein n=1 Tax=Thalassotalea sp. PLHSN55 TaxID=3435888 RepID=UPI003F85F413